MSIFCADLHIHSRFSRATSKKLTIPHLAAWSYVKGLSVVATGDITHPVWREELRQRLVRDEHSGLYRLNEPKGSLHCELPGIELPASSPDPLFLLQGEISSIYKKGGAVRKIHNMVFMPDFESTDKLCKKLEAIGNLYSDGRPILGLDARNLLEIVLETDERGVVIPAHIWTPWFSLFGSKSGFNSLDECFEDLAPHIFALETGLSSDPRMNRLWSHLDTCALISNSDAHSGDKLGREGNLFTGLPSYDGIFDAFRRSASGIAALTDPIRYMGTVEFFPEEGKYFLDGHRACGVVVEPQEAIRMGNICPVCGNTLTIGVLHRVLELADRTEPYIPEGMPPYYSFIPLVEILGELLCVGSTSKKVLDKYIHMIHHFGSEFDILHTVEESDLRQYWDSLGEAIARMRRGQVIREGGYDGEYGTIKVFDESERASFVVGKLHPARTKLRRQDKQEHDSTTIESKHNMMPLFKTVGLMLEPESIDIVKEALPSKKGERILSQDRSLINHHSFVIEKTQIEKSTTEECTVKDFVYSASQQMAIHAGRHPVLVLAGPGSGKTRTLVGRIEYLLSQGIESREILAVTFSRRSAEDLYERIQQVLGKISIRVDTLHALALAHWPMAESKIQPHILSEEAAQAVFIKANEGTDTQELKSAWDMLMLAREKLVDASALPAQAYIPMLEKYRSYKQVRNMADYTDLLEQWIAILQGNRFMLPWKAILVDEIQDLSALQLALVKSLVPASGEGFFGIGDPDQSIYSFRGAHPDVRAVLSSIWSNLEVVSLMESYRSVADIVSSSIAVLGTSKQSGTLISTRSGKAFLHLFTAPDYRREASWISTKISQLIGGSSHTLIDASIGHESHPLAGTCSPGEIAVLVRIKALMKPIQESLDRMGIPCVTPEVDLFWEDQRVALLLGLAGRKVGKPFGIQAAPDPSSIATHVWSGGPSALLAWLEPVPPFDPLFRESTAFKNLIKAYKMYGSWEKLLDWICLRQEIDLVKSQAEHVQIMTLHASKGLEFKVVFLPAVEEGLVPFMGMQPLLQGTVADYSPLETIAEERRLLYVGISRATDAIFMSHAEQRLLYGKTLHLAPSRFLVDLPEMFQRSQLVRYVQKKPSQMSLFD